MGESSTSSAMCKVCWHRHRQGDPHIWDSGPAVIGRSSSTVEPVICNHQVEGSIPSSGPKKPWVNSRSSSAVERPLKSRPKGIKK